MKRIVEALKQKGFEILVPSDEIRLDAATRYVRCMVLRSGTGGYTLRFTPEVCFDRWSVASEYSKGFATERKVVEYIENNQTEIYQRLFEILTEEYRELYGKYESEVYG